MKHLFAIYLILFCMSLFGYTKADTLVCLSKYNTKAHIVKKVTIKSIQTNYQFSSGRLMSTFLNKSTVNSKKGKKLYILVHGLGKSSEDLEQRAVELTAKGHDVLRVDLHGHGATADINKYKTLGRIPFEYNRDDLAEMIEYATLNLASKSQTVSLVGHSYGGGILIAALQKIKNKKAISKISNVDLLSPLVKSLDKYYQDSMLTGQNYQVAMDLMVPYWKAFGIDPQYLEIANTINKAFLFNSIELAQKFRDQAIQMNPIFEATRDSFSYLPNLMGNMIMGPLHMLAVSDIAKIQKWQLNPLEFYTLLLNNFYVITGVRNLNLLDYSKPLNLPKHIQYSMIIAENDSVNPNTLNEEFVDRMRDSGLSVTLSEIPNQNHYYFYDSQIAEPLSEALK